MKKSMSLSKQKKENYQNSAGLTVYCFHVWLWFLGGLHFSEEEMEEQWIWQEGRSREGNGRRKNCGRDVFKRVTYSR